MGNVRGLALEAVTKEYGTVVALDDVSVAVPDSGFHCLLGPNGSGKTTMLRLLLGLERPTQGQVHREGVTLGCGFQDPSFYPSLSVRENLVVFAGLLDGADADWRDRLVEELRLEPALHRIAGDLSGGYARKLDLALAMLDQPDVVLLDEPLGALDDVSRQQLLVVLRDYCEAGNAVVVSTHQVSVFEPYLDHVTVVFDGEVRYDGAPSELGGSSAGPLQTRYLDLVGDRGAPDGVTGADPSGRGQTDS